MARGAFRARTATLLIAASLLSGCTEPARVDQGPLIGSWAEDGDTTAPHYLTFGQGKLFAFIITHADGSWTSIGGSYATDGNHIELTPTLRYDFPASGPMVATNPYSDARFFDDATFEVTSSSLTLNYLSYPAEKAVPSVMTFHRDVEDAAAPRRGQRDLPGR